MSFKHQQCQKHHAIRRFMERYGEVLDNDIYQYLNDQISIGNARFIDNLTSGRVIWLVKLGKREIPCIYDNRYRQIATFMTKNWLKKTIKHLDRQRKYQHKMSQRMANIDRFFNKYLN